MIFNFSFMLFPWIPGAQMSKNIYLVGYCHFQQYHCNDEDFEITKKDIYLVGGAEGSGINGGKKLSLFRGIFGH